MKAVIQRVNYASVEIDGEITAFINKGYLILLGVGAEDDESDASLLALKISKLRIFTDENDKMNLSIKDVGGKVLVISNFTLYANCTGGNRPDFFDSAKPDVAKPLYEKFLSLLGDMQIETFCGQFGADMKVTLQNDGPVTIVLDSKLLKNKQHG
ncbi:MAG: D-aminoacyl-tRNA deacylase [Clostridia bacterium]|nr:D-aminoacyl-tRNA deacylase [Clostridia bacterium]